MKRKKRKPMNEKEPSIQNVKEIQKTFPEDSVEYKKIGKYIEELQAKRIKP